MADHGLFPGVPPRGDGRYAPGTRSDPRPWSLGEDLCLVPPILACESDRAYIATCRAMCRVLGRESMKCAISRPSVAEVAMAHVSLVEMRTVTRHLGGRVQELLGFLDGLGSAITVLGGRPLSWAARNKLIRPWYGKPDRGEPRIEKVDLLAYLHRPAGDPAVTAYLKTIPLRPRPPEPENLSAPTPATEPGFDAVVLAVARAESPATMVQTYRRLLAFCLGV